MTTHFSILAWKIPRTEEPGRLQSMGSQRVRHDWVGTRLVVQWLRLRASKKGTWVWSLVRELRFYMPRSAVKTNKPQLIKKKKKRERQRSISDIEYLWQFSVITLSWRTCMSFAKFTFRWWGWPSAPKWRKAKEPSVSFISDLYFRCCLSHLHRRTSLGRAFSKFHSVWVSYSHSKRLWSIVGHSVLL